MSYATLEPELPSLVKAIIAESDAEAQVYLFGSRARNDFNHDSDWDFFVATSKDDHRSFEDVLIDNLYDLMLERDELIQVITFPKDRWEKGHSPSPLYDNIRSEGLLL